MLLEACKRSVAARPVGTGYRVTVAANMINVLELAALARACDGVLVAVMLGEARDLLVKLLAGVIRHGKT